MHTQQNEARSRQAQQGGEDKKKQGIGRIATTVFFCFSVSDTSSEQRTADLVSSFLGNTRGYQIEIGEVH